MYRDASVECNNSFVIIGVNCNMLMILGKVFQMIISKYVPKIWRALIL